MDRFSSNALEPLSYLTYLVAVTLYMAGKKEGRIKVLFCYSIIAMVIMIAISATTVMQQTNIWLYDLFSLVTSIGVFSYFAGLFIKRTARRIVVSLLLFINAFYWITALAIVRSFPTFDSMGNALLSVSIVIASFLYFHQILTNVSEVNILDNFDFWFISSYLLYYSGSFLIFLTYGYFTTRIMPTYSYDERNLLTQLWAGHNILLFISSLITLSGTLWLIYRKRLS